MTRWKEGSEVQTLIFDKEVFPRAKDAKRWAKGHSFKHQKVDETTNTFRLRQRDPRDFVSGHFATIEMSPGVKAVVAEPKMPKMRRNPSYNQPGYKYYVVNATERFIDSGWEFREDAIERGVELSEEGADARVMTKPRVGSYRMDPDNDNHWKPPSRAMARRMKSSDKARRNPGPGDRIMKETRAAAIADSKGAADALLDALFTWVERVGDGERPVLRIRFEDERSPVEMFNQRKEIVDIYIQAFKDAMDREGFDNSFVDVLVEELGSNLYPRMDD
jgi:hypothetical protein